MINYLLSIIEYFIKVASLKRLEADIYKVVLLETYFLKWKCVYFLCFLVKKVEMC